MIKSFKELNEQALIILLEENPLSGIFSRVAVSDEKFDKIVEILNESKDDFLITTFTERYIVEDYIDMEED